MHTSSHQYQFRIKGHISENWASWFEGLSIQPEGSDTLICGEIADQTALHGVLMVIRDLGLCLIEVKCIDCEK